jgi:hypothetical protein
MKRIIAISGGLLLAIAFVVPANAATLNVVSDETVQWSDNESTNWQSAVATYVHPSWPIISGATWIWRTAQTNAPDEYATVPEGGWYFKKTFIVPECATEITGSIDINSDNAEALYFNGDFIGQDGALDKNGPDTQAWSTVKTYYPINPVVGENTILVRAINYFDTGTYTSNPAGLSFKATINYTENLDCDNDGVLNEVDFCPDTIADNPTKELGVNRHIWRSGDHLTTLLPKGKNKMEGQSSFTLAGTYGCSCEQILDEMVKATGFDFNGHYKFGCSKSIIEDWIAGKYFMERVTVPSTDEDGVESLATLDSDFDYTLKASGTACAAWDEGTQTCYYPDGLKREFDAEYTNYPNGTWGYDGWGGNPNYLDLMVNGLYVNWGLYSVLHEYEYTVTGSDVKLGLKIYDTVYLDNHGDLFVDIFANLW